MKLACLTAAAAVALAGCRVVGPNPAPPTAPSPAAFQEAPPTGWAAAQPSDAADKGAWWEVYGDARLNDLERRIGANFSLQTAQAQYLQARALIRFYRSASLPTTGAAPSLGPQFDDRNRPLSGGASATYTDFLLPFDASWEPDLWGGVKRATEQQVDLTVSQAAALANLRLSLQAELALDYFQARGLDAQAELLQRTVGADERALQLTETRHGGGVVSEVDVAQAQTQLETTRAQAQDVAVARAQFEHAIAVLMGEPPEGFHLPAAPLTGEPPPFPVGVPAALLQRRPDIAQAEREVAAANAAIGVAKAAFYPSLDLTAGAGLESTSLLNLFTFPSIFWGLGSGLTQTFTDGGRRRALTAAAQQGYEAQVSSYRGTVLQAFQEVEDNLAALRLLAIEAQTRAQAVAAAQHSLALSQTRYSGGVTTYLEVITAQTADLQNEGAAVDVLSRRMQASVLLIKALGGGWTTADLPAVSAAAH